VNCQLSEIQIRSTCRELIARGKLVSGRRLRRELAERFGAVGNTARVFQIWREETREGATIAPPPASPFDATLPRDVTLPRDAVLPFDVIELQRRLQIAEAAAGDNLARAERAEFREQAHQDHWAMEVDRLRQEALARPNQLAQIRTLSDQVHRLTVELHAVRSALVRQDAP
jgi:hypothetical protein